MGTEVQQRPMIAAMFRGPGPAAYFMPNETGHKGHTLRHRKAPAYVLGIKTDGQKYVASPGPAAYKPESKITRNGKDGTAVYTLHSRTTPFVKFNTPAPGDYAPEAQRIVKQPYAPKYSFGSRTPLHKKDNYPAPNNYTLTPAIGNQGRIPLGPAPPCYSMKKRNLYDTFTKDFAKTPGPANYGISKMSATKREARHITFGGRHYMPGDNTQKPGPDRYKHENVTVTKMQSPRISFGIRHSEYMAPVAFSLD